MDPTQPATYPLRILRCFLACHALLHLLLRVQVAAAGEAVAAEATSAAVAAAAGAAAEVEAVAAAAAAVACVSSLVLAQARRLRSIEQSLLQHAACGEKQPAWRAGVA